MATFGFVSAWGNARARIRSASSVRDRRVFGTLIALSLHEHSIR
jgi:hypothetical protein